MPYQWNTNSLPILQLGSEYFDPTMAVLFPLKKLRYWNPNISVAIEKDRLWDFKSLKGNLPEALALRYHGHQFQHYNPQLGDGRGFLYAQIKQNNQWYDLGTKGSGTTKYSRGGDGRLTLKGAVREALATEMLESLGVNTSKTLCFFETGENLTRGDEPSPTRSAVLTRFSLSHIRFGTFQRLAFLGESENIKKLVCYCLQFYYTAEIENINLTEETATAAFFLNSVAKRSADTLAQIMMAGFVHGVLNTDNMNISGELFDYGPYRFLPTYDPNFTAAYFDHNGLYAFGRQPSTYLWNLEQLAAALKIAHPALQSTEILQGFSEKFNSSLRKSFLARLNLNCEDTQVVSDCISAFFSLMEEKKLNFEKTFFDFYSADWSRAQKSTQADHYCGSHFDFLKSNLSQMHVSDLEKTKHKYFQNQNPETLLIDEIESIWSAIDLKDDWSLFENKLQSCRAFRGLYTSL